MILTKKYDKIYEQWIRSCSTIGKNIEAILPESENIRGMVTNVLPDGGILIRTGEAEKVLYAGDIRTRII